MTFKFEDYDEYGNDEFADYVKVDIDDYLDKPFIIEKAETTTDKNGDVLRMGVDINGQKLMFYTSSKRLRNTIATILAKEGVVPAIPVKIVEEKYANSPNPGYKFVTV